MYGIMNRSLYAYLSSLVQIQHCTARELTKMHLHVIQPNAGLGELVSPNSEVNKLHINITRFILNWILGFL